MTHDIMKDFLRQVAGGLDGAVYGREAMARLPGAPRLRLEFEGASVARFDLRGVSPAERHSLMIEHEDAALAAWQGGTLVLPFALQLLLHSNDYIEDYGISPATPEQAQAGISQLCFRRNPETGIWTGPSSIYKLDEAGLVWRVARADFDTKTKRLRPHPYKADEVMPARASLALMYYLSLPKSHTVVVDPVPKATNLLRRQRGLSPLPPMRVIHLNPLPTRVYQPMDTERKPAIGHEVRGHLRRYRQKNGSILLRPVRPHSRCGGGAKPQIALVE